MKQKLVSHPKTGFSSRTLLLMAMMFVSTYSIFAISSSSCATVAVYASSTTLCGSSTDTFTTMLSHGGAHPTYQWFENGNPVGGNSASYISTGVTSTTVITVSVSGAGTCLGDTLLHPYSISGTAPAVTVGVIPATPTIAVSGHGCAFSDSVYVTNSSGLSFANWFVNGQNYTVPGTADSVVLGAPAHLYGPAGIAVNASGTIYVADRDSNRVLAFAAGSQTGVVVIRGLNSPKAVFSAGAYLFIADNNNHRILKVNASTGAIVSTFGGVQGLGLDQLNYPSDVFATGPNYDTVYVADQGNNRIQKYVVGSSTAATVAGGVYGPNTSPTGLNEPSSVCVDAAGNMYVADQSNNRVMIYAPGSNIGTALIYLASPSVVRLDQNGALYVTSALSNQVYKYTAAELIRGLNGGIPQGTALLHSNVLFATSLQHAGLAVTGSGKVYVCDGGHDRVLLAGTAAQTTTGFSLVGPYQGSFTATVVNAAGCVSTVSNAVTVNAYEYPYISLLDNSLSSLCNGAIGRWTAQVSGALGTSLNYIWRIDTVIRQTGPSNSFSYPVNPNTTVMTLEVRSNYICPSPLPAIISVSPTPYVYASMAYDTLSNFCTGVHTFIANGSVTGNVKYKWYKNGVVVGDSTGRLTIAVALHDSIWVKMISTLNCAGVNNILSGKVKIGNTPSVSIQASDLCSGTNSTFTAYASYEGTNPIYTWYKNGSVMSSGANSTATFATTGNDSVWVVLTSNDPCAYPTTAQSEKTVMVLTPNMPVLSGGTCLGSAITLGSNQNGNTTIWLKDLYQIASSNLSGSASYPEIPGISRRMVPPYTGSYTAVAAMVTPSLTCYSPVSNAITISPTTTLGVAVTSTGTEACSSTAITFTATAPNATIYQWFKNNIPVGTGSIYSGVGFNFNDSVWVRVSTTTPCVSPNSVLSSKIYIRTASSSTPSLSVICSNTNLDIAAPRILTATPTNAGIRPVYTWYKNGALIRGVTTSSFTYGGALGNGDQIYATLLTSSCGSAQPAISNSVTFTKSGSTAKDITVLTMPNQVGTSVIDNVNATVSAVVTTAPAGRVAIHPTRLYTSVNSSYGPSYAINRDFSMPVTYTVAAQDGSTRIWTVTVLDQSGNKTSAETGSDIVNTEELMVYPNPAASYLILTTQGGAEPAVVTISDVEGRVMYNEKLPVADRINHQIDLADYPTGTYVMYVSMGNKLQSREFVVSK